jgi:hypothetical protein
MTAVGTAPMSFERAELAAGDRSLVSSLIALPSPPSADAPWPTYPTTYYPSTSSFGAATTVRAQPGRDRANVDLTLRPVATYQVSGTLRGPEGPAAHHVVHLLAGDAADFPVADVSAAVTDANGAFTLYGVPPGQYVARVVRTPWPGEGHRLAILGGTGAIPSIGTVVDSRPSGLPPIPTEALLYANQPVSVGDRHVRDVSITMRPGPRVTGRVEFEGSAPRPAAPALQNVPVALELASGQAYSSVFPGQFSADGLLTTPSMLPGRYLIRVTRPPAAWVFKGASYQGRDVSETPLDLTADVDSVVVTFTDRPSKIEGTVQASDAQPAAGAMVICFPADPAAWTGYGRNSRRVRSVTTTVRGAFTFTAPPEGDYVLVAIHDSQAADWQNPDVLRKLAAIGERVQVRGDQPVVKTLPVRRLQ